MPSDNTMDIDILPEQPAGPLENGNHEAPDVPPVASTSQPSQPEPPLASGVLVSAVGTSDLSALKARLRAEAQQYIPSIFKRGSGEAHFLAEQMGVTVMEWGTLSRGKPGSNPRSQNTRSTRAAYNRQADYGGPRGGMSLHPNMSIPKLSKVVKSKSNGAGRQYTSQFRGVHQTFPTKRWEAQFRRNGKPTSLGCFDQEEQAARAYDKMMLWCEIHNSAGLKSGIMNYDSSEYEKDLPWLQSVTQDELIEALRSDGRRQAAHRMLKQKRDGAPATYSGGGGAAAGSGRSRRTSREGTSEREASEDMGTVGVHGGYGGYGVVGGGVTRGSSLNGGESVGAPVSGDPEMDSQMEASRME